MLTLKDLLMIHRNKGGYLKIVFRSTLRVFFLTERHYLLSYRFWWFSSLAGTQRWP